MVMDGSCWDWPPSSNSQWFSPHCTVQRDGRCHPVHESQSQIMPKEDAIGHPKALHQIVEYFLKFSKKNLCKGPVCSIETEENDTS